MNSNENAAIGTNWWLWVPGLIILIGGLWFCIKGCNQKEMSDRVSGTMNRATEVFDSVKQDVQSSAEAGMEYLDSAGRAFKRRWNTLGNYMHIKLGEFYLSLPEKGIELKLLDWINNKLNKVDNTTWFNFDRVLFDEGSAKLNIVSNEQVYNIATIMKSLPAVEFEIGGYTDNTGDAAANKKLSLERAEAVKAGLVEHGIDPKRLTTKGYGPENPIADNATPEGRELNRRVGVRVTKK